MVALTFDAGADRGYARQILDTLAAHRVSGYRFATLAGDEPQPPG